MSDRDALEAAARELAKARGYNPDEVHMLAFKQAAERVVREYLTVKVEQMTEFGFVTLEVGDDWMRDHSLVKPYTDGEWADQVDVSAAKLLAALLPPSSVGQPKEGKK